MCVVSIAWDSHPTWLLVVAGNRDEYHARASAPLGPWEGAPHIMAGRDMVSGGTWMGVSEGGRFAVVTNIRDPDGPDATRMSRGALVSDWLNNGTLPENPDRYNPFNLIVFGPDGLVCLANRPARHLAKPGPGIHGLSNAIPGEHWPRKDRLNCIMHDWLANSADDPARLLTALADQSKPDDGAHPIFIANPVYGTRCSTVITVSHSGEGRIIERSFNADGTQSGEVSLHFGWAPTGSSGTAVD